MSVIAPSSTGASVTGQIPSQRQIAAQDLGAQLTQNWMRQQANLSPMAGAELDTFQQRQQQDRIRQDQMTALDAALDDQKILAEELGANLQRAGLAEAAERYRRASQRAAFNAARRGIAGGSADLTQQTQLQSEANQEARNVTQETQAQVLQEILKAQQSRDKLAGQIVSENPFLLQQEQGRIGGIQQATTDAARVAEMQAQARAAGLMARGGIGQAIGGFLGNAGQVAGGALMGSA